MASRKLLKKEIYYITSDLITENYIRYQLLEGYDNAKYRTLAFDIAKLNNEFLNRINHPEGTKDAKRIKAFYRAIANDFNQQVDALVAKMDEGK